MTLDPFGRNALMHAVIAGDTATARDIVNAGADIDVQDRQGWAALHFAAQNNDKAIADVLLNGGADIGKRDSHGNTPLFRAVFNYRNGPECITTLLAAGADPDVLNNHGVSPRSLAYTIANYDTARFFPRQ